MTPLRLSQLCPGDLHEADRAMADALGPVRVVNDSRACGAGTVFACWGSDAQRQAHAQDAVARGVCAVLADQPLGCDTGDIPVFLVPDVRLSFARACLRAHGLTAQHPPILGITGTDGKTSVNYLLWQLLGVGAARIGTLGWHDGQQAKRSAHTTPPADAWCPFVAALPADCPAVVMEISSIAADQHRLGDCSLQALVVTGIGHDHLDYHGTYAAYIEAKLAIVDQLAAGATMVVNADDAYAQRFMARAQARQAQVISLGWSQAADARLQGDPPACTLQFAGQQLPVQISLPGHFNSWNAAAAVLVAASCGLSWATLTERLPDLQAVPGRLQPVAGEPMGYVDYAHTPEAIERVLAALRSFHAQQRLVCVFGCGGDRDTSKRGPMGRAALAADRAVLTADNPRKEGQSAIAADVLQQLGSAADQIIRIDDRRDAIRFAVDDAGRNGVVVVCGKGHEGEQVFADQVLPFDDVHELSAALAEVA